MPMSNPPQQIPFGIFAQNSTLQSFPNGNVSTVVTSWTTIYDTSNGAWNANTGVFTVPVSGWYEITGQLQLANASFNAGDDSICDIAQNGTLMARGQHRVEANVTTYELAPSTSTVLRCAKGDTLTLGCSINYGTTGTKTLSGLTSNNFVSIIQIGAL